MAPVIVFMYSVPEQTRITLVWYSGSRPRADLTGHHRCSTRDSLVSPPIYSLSLISYSGSQKLSLLTNFKSVSYHILLQVSYHILLQSIVYGRKLTSHYNCDHSRWFQTSKQQIVSLRLLPLRWLAAKGLCRRNYNCVVMTKVYVDKIEGMVSASSWYTGTPRLWGDC